MEFTINRSDLARELNHLQGVVERKNTIPILANVLVETRGESLVALTATDQDLSMQTECEAQVTRPGAILLGARKLSDIVRNLPDGEVHLSKQDNDWGRIICGSSDFKVVGQPVDQFPAVPILNKPGRQIAGATLGSLISRTIYAITSEESRYALSGSLFIAAENSLDMVSTDGHRLAIAGVRGENAGKAGDVAFRVNVPKKALAELLKLTAGLDEPVEFIEEENHLFFRIGLRRLTTRLLAGQFPNYELVLPKTNDKTVVLNTERFAQSIRRVALMADERSRSVKFDISKGRIVISSQSAEVGEARDIVPIDYEGEDVAIGFNAQYLLDFFNAVGVEEVDFEFKDEMSPVLLHPHGEEADSYRYVVMPMRLL